MNNYIILDIGKIVICWDNREKSYYKEVNNKLISINNEEKNYLNNIFQKPYSYELNSEYLTKLIDNNSNIKEKERMTILLTWLENIVPDNAKNNFYNNIQTLKVDYVTDNLTNNYSVASYNSSTNEIHIYPTKIQEAKKIAMKTSNPADYLSKQINQTILHELCHTASSRYDQDTKISKSGFNTYPTNQESERNLGLTEGMTEVISMYGIPNTMELASNYYIEASIINQLISIIGNKELINSYFMNNGTSKLEEELNQYTKDSNVSWNLFRNIEANFCIQNDNIKQTFLGNIQNTLVDYLASKLKNAVISNEEKQQSISLFKAFIITPIKLTIMKKNPDNYIGLQDSINKFNNTINQYNSEINIERR